MSFNSAGRLPPDVNRILYVKNLPFKINPEDLYDIFGKYGTVRQIRVGNAPRSRGTAYVAYDDIYQAKAALEGLQGYHVMNRYLVVLYHQRAKMAKKMDLEKKQKELERLKAKFGVDGLTGEN
eukprot:TRINITY_DN44_c0_g1_i2.p2 TRINITY_DN44_c0_g1~~TRINITY_DN44_c0_g1_i2.p2  ORF type:complete len:123 (+),score=36.19 TRINITY_DN44_c0_g1_i2:85-453(+)